MLPNINLDDEMYSQIFEKTKKMIPSIYPEWTDYNEHDPGITFLQLFSYFKEMQQYHLNRISESSQSMYLKLLGYSIKRRTPAKADIVIGNDKDMFHVPKGARFFAKDIVFEAICDEMVENMQILLCQSQNNSQISSINKDVIYSGSHMKFLMFGEKPHMEDAFYIMFDKGFSTKHTHDIYFEISDEYEVRRNPIQKDYYKMADFVLEYYSNNQWKCVNLIKDETLCFIESGKVHFAIYEEMDLLEGGYWIRFRLVKCEYDVPPVLLNLKVNTIYAEQVKTLADYQDFEVNALDSGQIVLILDSYLAITGNNYIYVKNDIGFELIQDVNYEYAENEVRCSFHYSKQNDKNRKLMVRVVSYDVDFAYIYGIETDGFPNQSYNLFDKQIVYDSFHIMVENNVTPNIYEDWHKVTDYYSSSPEDMHYILDDENGKLLFGDLENALAPEGRIIIIRYKQTIGIDGNVKAGQINRYYLDQVETYNLENSYGGSNKESIEACFKRYQCESKEVKRAVTDSDYETLVKSTPGLMIRNVKAVLESSYSKESDSNCVTLVVEPYSLNNKGILNDSYKKNIYSWIDRKRMIGTKVKLLSPEYIAVNICIEAVVKSYHINARESLNNAVTKYFEDASKNFGHQIYFNELYGIIDSLECVCKLQSLSITSKSIKVKRNLQGDLFLPPNGLACVNDIKYYITSV